MGASFVVFTAPGGRRGRGALKPGEKPSFRERMNALRYVPQLLRLTRAFIPIATLWIGKLIIDGVVGAQRTGGSWRAVGGLVAIELAIVIAGELLARASSLVESLLGDLFSNRISVRLMQHAATLDLAQFEDPDFYDHLERARRQTVGRIGLIAQLLGLAQGALTLITLSAALLAFNPWLMVLLIVAIVPSFLGETRFAAMEYSLLFRWTPERRQLDYLRWVGASDDTAKEVQLFGLADWLTERYRVLSDRWYAENKKLAVRKAVVSSALSLIGTAGYYAAYIVIIARAVGGSISLGSLTFLAASFSRGRDLIQNLLLGASGIYEQGLYLRDLFMFFEMKPTISSRPGAPEVPRPIRAGFVFENVGFKYPGSERWAVRHASFTLHPGERIALVGENGAGKTTLTKLLARLYDPSEGRILLDGRDLRDYDLASLRREIGVVFQDFVRYDMRFDENVGVGEIESLRGYLDNGATGSPPNPLVHAADQSLASALLPRFPAGYRQMLGRRFDDGVDLSGGEWQKIALARAYMRDAQVLILDEPTAALDARAEYEVFKRFSELMAGRMGVLISHRFSTVRMADRIVVLKAGEVVEQGTHEELVGAGGLYAELFGMQAVGYR
jgi:ATP-binding cassette subfamily B protein